MQFKIKYFLINFYWFYSACVSIFLNLIYQIYYIVRIYSLHLKINLIVIFINVFKDIFANFNINAYFHINVNIIFNR